MALVEVILNYFFINLIIAPPPKNTNDVPNVHLNR